MIFFVLFLFCLALGVFIYIKHKQTEREIHKRERLEEKQEQLMELLRKRKDHSP
jgi:cbb3-type cytochrome oxidase subunit 3